MSSLEKVKAQLGKLAEGYSDEQLMKIDALTEKFAAIVFEMWLDQKKRRHKNTTPLWIRESG